MAAAWPPFFISAPAQPYSAHPRPLLPATPKACGVSLTGLEYPLHDATLTFGTSLGMSNVFVETQATVTLSSGRLFVFHLYGS